MGSLKKLFTGALIILTLNLYLTNISFAEYKYSNSKPEITEHAPQSRTMPEKDVPKVKVKKTSGWSWLIVIALIGGIAAVASGGGGGESGGGGGVGETGSISGSW